MYHPRNRAWRRATARLHGGDRATRVALIKPEKNWKLMYLRSAKLARARQLGFVYPIQSVRQQLEQP